MIWNPRRAATVCASTLGLLMLGMTPAVAHVTVHTDDGVQGASDAAVMFRTPDEEDHAATVKLQVFFPKAHPLLDVLVEPHQGWHSTTKIATLAHPVTTDDGKITKAVSEVTWTADSTADGLQPGEGDDFVVTAGQLPDTASITFRALQTYSDGDVVKWIESQAPGAPEPDHPAPVLRLEPPSTSNSNGATNGSPAPSVTASSSASSSSDALARGLAIAALVVAVIAAALAGRGLRRPG
jgi:uncharacterized protein YcnI